MRGCPRLVPSLSWKCESWLSAPAGKISGIESLRLDGRRFGWIRHPEHSRGIPLRYLKDSIMGSLGPTRNGGFPRGAEFFNEKYSINRHRPLGFGPTKGPIPSPSGGGGGGSETP